MINSKLDQNAGGEQTLVKNRTTMNGKPVIMVDSKSVINFKSNFSHKLLCDGLTFTSGSSCGYSCSFCYVEDLMRKNPHRIENPENHTKIVIRRRNPIEIVKKQLTKANGEPKFLKCEDTRVIYASPLVDVAANLELARETVEICKVILQLTNWEIRLLSKSNLLPKIADALSEYKNRIIYGVSTGNLNDRIAAAYERGTPKVSKRLESLWWLQDNGYRTFGMICPSLPLESDLDYDRFAVDCAKAIRADRCEHVWAEVINVRGESFERTKTALNEAGFNAEAELLEAVTYDKAAWEAYARKTFEAHAKVYESQPGKLRFLQYVNKSSRAEYWNSQVARGAVLL